MKHLLGALVCALIIGLGMSSCSGNTYANSLKAEKELIADFIEREHINVLQEFPSDSIDWGEKDYVDLSGYGFDYLYFHLSKRGETEGDSVVAGSTIVLRYKRYELGVTRDTISYWTTNDSAEPVTFAYGQDYTTACTAWHAAVKYMKFSGSEAKIICPSKLGFETEQSSVTPYGYDLKIKIKKY